MKVENKKVSSEQIIQTQRDFFNTGITRDVEYRKQQLRILKKAIINQEDAICKALKQDLHKSTFESYATEIGIILEEIDFTLKHLSSWARPKRVKSPLAQWPSKSYQYHDPYGVVLIMAPWNYPFHLTIAPLIGAICGGNCAILKPSNYSPATSALIRTLIAKIFSPKFVTVVEGGREANQDLLKQKFDYIFFTGGVTVGKLVMHSAAENLTPISLELGGKSPCIIDNTASVKLAAKRIVWGKFLNAGQTCIAPDYILVDASVKEELINEMKYYITESFGSDPIHCEQFTSIISEKHFDRLHALIDGSDPANGQIVYGAKTDNLTRRIEPTILDEPNPDSPVMNNEIFGPIMPIISYPTGNLDFVIDFVSNRPHPLALYFFTNNKQNKKRIISTLQYGGGCINDTIIHLATSLMPFGGVGNSGMGSYHGKQSFTTFTHTKSVLAKSNKIDIPIRYPPYTDKKLKILKKFM
ncbi:MAG: aldehyde dehydrogenase family protein [Treponema sp. CETP13]|nr:MAG: aldehyde dehydrogenase family protein [Treponema sp. CETP13]